MNERFVLQLCSETGYQISYSELIDQSLRWGGFLKQNGFQKGDVITVVLENCPQFAPLFLGTVAIGAILSPINSRLMPGK